MATTRTRSSRAQSSLATRLTLAFVGVTLLGLGIVAGLASVLGGQRVDAMVEDRRVDLIRALQANGVATYSTARGGWSADDWEPALDLAARYVTNAAVLDPQGRVIASTPESPLGTRDAYRSEITVGGERVGTLVVDFTGGLAESAHGLRGSLLTALLGAAGLAALAALLVALAVSRRLTAPLARLIGAAGAMSRGARDVRVGPLQSTPRELKELGAAFDAMADALAEQEQLRRNLVADIAHELRTPVAVLQANLEALTDGVVEHTIEQTESLHEEVLRLAERVEDLQSLARADAAALSLRVQSCDLAKLTATAIEQLAAQVKTRRVDIRSNLQPVIVQGDPARLHQVITNLLVNACKFTPEGGRVDIGVGPVDGGGARLVVSDTGVGIAPDDLPHVFERFWRSKEAATVAGSGVGLSIVEQLVAAHGGTVQVASERGAGTEVTVSLPEPGPSP